MVLKVELSGQQGMTGGESSFYTGARYQRFRSYESYGFGALLN